MIGKNLISRIHAGMRFNSHRPPRKPAAWVALCLLLGSPMAAHSQADTVVVVPAKTDSVEMAYKAAIPPTTNFYALPGLSQTSSAEALGMGRLVIGVHGTWYEQQRTFIGVPPKDAQIFSGIGAAAFGLNRWVDIFASLTGYGSTDWNTDSSSGLGVVGAGLKGTLPAFQASPLWLGAELGVFYGFAENQIDYIRSDGYNYHETRTDLDFIAKLLQTLEIGEEAMALKFHLNEGIVTTVEDGVDPLLLLAAGAQVNLLITVLGLEIHSRTSFDDLQMTEDPWWITPSVQIRTPLFLDFNIGADFSLSETRDGPVKSRSLEPYRVFGGIVFNFDTQAKKKQAAAQKVAADAQAQAQMQQQVDSLALQAKEDSLALAESQKNLAEEKAKRTAAENQLLNTGILLLDTCYFETAKAVLSLNSRPYLKVIAMMLTKYPKLQLEVAGHTDNVGNAKYNLGLSQDRAQAVVDYLIEQQPSLKGTITAKGYGETEPVADNATDAGRKVNRRTELRVLNRVALKDYNP